MNKPAWTVHCNWDNGTQWVGRHWEFFNTKEEAEECYLRLNSEGHCGCMRPFDISDVKHMGAAHLKLFGGT